RIQKNIAIGVCLQFLIPAVNHSNRPKHWADEQALGGRAYFRYTDDPAKLTVESVRESDGGTYRL
ncbi:hypothetical protein L9F63_003445, partial [Diploptera punctata]